MERALSTVSGWQERRGSINHVSLVGQYIPELCRWLNILSGKVENPEFADRFQTTIFPQWGGLGQSILALTAEFESAMSPQCLIDRSPLSKLPADARRWLGHLVHGLWMNRNPVRGWIDRVTDSVVAADAKYAAISACFGGSGDPGTHDSARLIEEFCECCRAVSVAIGEFPRDVRVV